MNLSDYDYTLPAELIAQTPAEVRDNSRLMILPPDSDSVVHSLFCKLPEFLDEKDLIVVNDTRVFPARLIGRKEKTGGEVEIFLLHPHGDENTWNALSKPAKRLRPGTVVNFEKGTLFGEITEKGIDGHVLVRLSSKIGVTKAINKIGKTPLPPYIKHEPEKIDRLRYQTVYAKNRGAVAAPTAGLHFTAELFEKLSGLGIQRASVTLHVGIGTFRPLTDKEALGERLHSEYCVVGESAVESIRQCRTNGGRIIAVGTTTARALETASAQGEIKPYSGWTDIFIREPYVFKSVDALITNFHLPRSSLLVMVSAFAGMERIGSVYREAICKRYRFYSYGDAMLIFGRNS